MAARSLSPELARVRSMALVLTGLFLCKAAAVILFILPTTSLAGNTGFLAWLNGAYEVRVGLLVVTGLALYGTLAAMVLASVINTRSASSATPAVRTETKRSEPELLPIAAE